MKYLHISVCKMLMITFQNFEGQSSQIHASIHGCESLCKHVCDCMWLHVYNILIDFALRHLLPWEELENIFYFSILRRTWKYFSIFSSYLIFFKRKDGKIKECIKIVFKNNYFSGLPTESLKTLYHFLYFQISFIYWNVFYPLQCVNMQWHHIWPDT